jgi:hypothetical protein
MHMHRATGTCRAASERATLARMRWPWSRKRRATPSVEQALGELKVERERLKLQVGKAVVQSNPELALRFLWGGGRNAAMQTHPEKSLAEKYFEKQVLEGGDGWSKLREMRQLLREERMEMEASYSEDDEQSPIERSLERFGGPLIAGLAALVNPAGYQQAMQAMEEQKRQQVQVAEVSQQPRPAMPRPDQAQSYVEGEIDQEDDNVLPLPVKPATVLANMEGLPPAVFAQWALAQPAVRGQVLALAGVPDDQLMAMLAAAESNPFAREWQDVFKWLRANPERTSAIVQALRTMTAAQDDPDDVAL